MTLRPHPNGPADPSQELLQLRLRCAKIDEIERCALLLVETNQQLKVKLDQTELQLSEAERCILQLREESRHVLIQQSRELRRSPEPLRRNDHEDNYQSLRLQQQLASEQQGHERAISTLESRQRAEQFKLSQQLKTVSVRLEEEQKVREATAKESHQLKTRLHETEQQLRSVKNEGERTAAEVKRYRSLCQELEGKTQQQQNHIIQLQTEREAISSSLRGDNEQLMRAFETAETRNSSLERMNEQLRQEGAAIILENQRAEAKLEELKAAHALHQSTIQQLMAEIQRLRNSSQFQDEKIIEARNHAEAVTARAEQECMRLKCQLHTQTQEIATKQQEIEDLIAITAQLEQETQRHAHSATEYQQTARKHHAQLQQLITLSETQNEQLAFRTRKEQEQQTLLDNLQRQYQTAMETVHRSEETLHKQIKLTQEKEGLLMDSHLKLTHLERANAKVKEELRLREQREKEDNLQIQTLYLKEKEENHLLRERTAAEKQENVHLREQMVGLRQEIVSMNEQLQQQDQDHQLERKEQLQSAMQQMEELVSQKYDEILEQYKQYFIDKVQQLQQQIATLTAPPPLP